MRGNPSPHRPQQWKPGQSGNPGGKTAEQRKAEVEAAERAARIQARMLAALEKHITDGDGDGAEADAKALASIAADPLRLIKDAMDRAHGQAMQPVEVETKSMSETEVARRIAFVLAQAVEQEGEE